MHFERESVARCFGGEQGVYTHESATLACAMRVGVFMPESEPKAVLYWLSGLTCTEQNFITKAGAQRVASGLGLVLVAPDTSPRGVDVPGQDESYDLGSGAGFYVDATREPWSKHYRMYSYIVDELVPGLEKALGLPDKRGIFGHSMGGHGALVLGLRNPNLFQTISAFAPLVAPSQVPWGTKAFSAYLGDDRGEWARYDACELVRSGDTKAPLLVDQGLADNFLEEQLKPELLESACKDAGHSLTLNRREGYDHSYYFIASYVENHLRHHAEGLG